MSARRRPRGRPGSTLPMTAVCTVSLFAFTALAVDLGMVMIARTECQNASDAAALAGARQLNTVDPGTNNQPAALVAADDTAAQNPLLNTQFQGSSGSIATATAWGTTAGRSLASGQGTGSVPKSISTGGKVSGMKVGLYSYNTATQQFKPDFVSARTTNQAWTAVQVDTTSVQPAFFSRVFGMAGLQTQARAVAIHRPRDIALVLDMSNSMRFGSVWNWNTHVTNMPYDNQRGQDGGGALSPDPLHPQFGHYARYTGYNSTSPATPNTDWNSVTDPAARPNPFYQTSRVALTGSSEYLSPHNYSVETGGGPAAVKDFLSGSPQGGANPTSTMARAFHNWDPPGFAPVFGGPSQPVSPTGDFTGWQATAPMPAPPTLTTQTDGWQANRSGDRWPRKKGVTSTSASWAVDNPQGAAVTAAEFLGWTAPFDDTNKNWPTDTSSDGFFGYTRLSIRGVSGATVSTSLPDQFTGGPLTTATFTNRTAGGNFTVGYKYTVNTLLSPFVGTPTAMPRLWDNFRDATWERNGYDLDVEHYAANRPADWDPRWEWDLKADRTKPNFGGTPAWGGGAGATSPTNDGETPLGSPADFPRPAGMDPAPSTAFRPRLKPAEERFKGYTLSPGYYGKTFFIWPPDPRTPVGEPGDANYQPGDWRERFFVWTPPIDPRISTTPTTPPSPPAGQQVGGTYFQPGTTTEQYQGGSYQYWYQNIPTPPSGGSTSTSGSTSGSGGSSGSSGSSSGTSGTPPPPPPPPPPPTRHDRPKKLSAADVVRLRNQADKTEFAAAMVLAGGVAGQYPAPSQFGNLNRSLFMDAWQDTNRPMPLSNPFGSNDHWGFQFNYKAFFKWLKQPPQTLPNSLRAGRLVYYTSIPDDITGSGTADQVADQMFWREYVEFVLGHWEYRYDQRWLAGFETVGWPELNGVRVPARVNMEWVSLGGDGLNDPGTGYSHLDSDRLDDGANGGYDPNPLYGRMKWKEFLALPAATKALVPAGKKPQLPRDLRPYMGYMDNPARPRMHLWFGPLSMMAYLANVQQPNPDNGNTAANMWPGTATEAQSWQLKAAVDSALDDVQKNHPNDAVGLAYFSSKIDSNWNVTSGYNTIAAPLGQDFTRIKNSLYYPLQLVKSGAVSNPQNEWRPYSTGNMLTYNGKTLVPNSQDGTDPNTGMALAYNLLTPSTSNAAIGRATDGTQSGRRGAAKIVIFETDGAPTAARTVQFNPAGQNSFYSVQNTGNYSVTPRDAALAVVDQIVAPVNTGGSAPSGFSTPNTPARVYAIGFGDLFNVSGSPTTTQAQAMDFLRDVMIRGNTLPASAGAQPGYVALPPDHIVGDPRYTDRMNKLRSAFERILQSGVQVTLIE